MQDFTGLFRNKPDQTTNLELAELGTVQSQLVPCILTELPRLDWRNSWDERSTSYHPIRVTSQHQDISCIGLLSSLRTNFDSKNFDDYGILLFSLGQSWALKLASTTTHPTTYPLPWTFRPLLVQRLKFCMLTLLTGIWLSNIITQA